MSAQNDRDAHVSTGAWHIRVRRRRRIVTKRAVLHIPSTTMLARRSLSHWIGQFESQARRPPTDVALPAVDYGGVSFDSEMGSAARGLDAGNQFRDWVLQCKSLLGPQIKIWASIIPAFQFVNLSSVMVADQYGTRLPSQVCLNQPVVQRIFEVIVAAIATASVDGIVIDATDIYPNSGSNAYRGLQNFCFCIHCLEILKRSGWAYGVGPFVGSHNIMRYLLKIEDTGTDNFAPRRNWVSKHDVSAVISYSIERGFVEEAEAKDEEVSMLLTYLRSRGETTSRALSTVFKVVSGAELSAAVILGDADFDVSQSVDLDILRRGETIQEFWLPDLPEEGEQSADVRLLAYLFSRASYYANGFFEDFMDAEERSSTVGINQFFTRLLRASNRFANNKLSPAAALAVDLSDGCDGLVGLPLVVDDAMQLLEELARTTLSDESSTNLLRALSSGR